MSTWSRANRLDKSNRKFRKPKQTGDSTQSAHSTHSTQSRPRYSNQYHQRQVYPGESIQVLQPVQHRPQVIVPLDPNIDLDNDVKDSKWKSIVLNEIDNDLKPEEAIQDSDPKYWDGHQWIGPRMVRYTVNDRITYKNIENKENKEHLITIRKKTQYSRNGIHWHKSWKDTFTPRQLHHQRKDLWERPMKLYANTCQRQIDEARIESQRYLEERGDDDDYAIVEKWHDDYDKFEKELMNNDDTYFHSSDED
jgi:hypothetical protein